jgi:hypothetical protein
MKIAAALLALTGAANAFTAAPGSAVKSTALKGTVFEDYPGNVDFKGSEFNFDPVSIAIDVLRI